MLYLLLVFCLLLKYSYPRPIAEGERCDPCPLHKAMLEEDPNFKVHFKQEDIHKLDKHGNTALHLAVMRNFKRGITFLLAKGAKVSAENDEGFNVLQEATCRGDPETLLQILRRSKKESTELYNTQRVEFIKRLESIRDSKWEFSFDGMISALNTGPLEIIFKVIPVPGRITIYKRGNALRMSIYNPKKDKYGNPKDKNDRTIGDHLQYTVLFNPKNKVNKDDPGDDRELVIMDLRKTGEHPATKLERMAGHPKMIKDGGMRYRKYRVKQDPNIVKEEEEILRKYKTSTFWMDEAPVLKPIQMKAGEAKEAEIFGEQHPTKKLEFKGDGFDLIMHRRLEHTQNNPINERKVKWIDYAKTFGSLDLYGQFPIGRQRKEGYIDLNVKAEITMAEMDERDCKANCKPSLDYLLDVYGLLLPYVHVRKVKDFFGKLQNNKVLNGLPTKISVWLNPDFQRYVGKMYVGGMLAKRSGAMTAVKKLNLNNMNFDFHYADLEGEEDTEDFFDIPKEANPKPDIMRYLYYFPAF